MYLAIVFDFIDVDNPQSSANRFFFIIKHPVLTNLQKFDANNAQSCLKHVAVLTKITELTYKRVVWISLLSLLVLPNPLFQL